MNFERRSVCEIFESTNYTDSIFIRQNEALRGKRNETKSSAQFSKVQITPIRFLSVGAELFAKKKANNKKTNRIIVKLEFVSLVEPD